MNETTAMTTVRIAVLGTGANGASMGADMVRAGLDVTSIEQWPAHVEATRENGLTVNLPDGTSEVTPVTAYPRCQVAELREPFDIVFTSVKTYDTRWATELIQPLLHETSLIVGLQNGMTINDVAAIVRPERSIGAVLGIAANMYTPGVVERQVPREGTWLTVGTMDGARTPALAAAVDALGHAGAISISDDIRASKWMKLPRGAHRNHNPLTERTSRRLHDPPHRCIHAHRDRRRATRAGC